MRPRLGLIAALLVASGAPAASPDAAPFPTCFVVDHGYCRFVASGPSRWIAHGPMPYQIQQTLDHVHWEVLVKRGEPGGGLAKTTPGWTVEASVQDSTMRNTCDPMTNICERRFPYDGTLLVESWTP